MRVVALACLACSLVTFFEAGHHRMWGLLPVVAGFFGDVVVRRVMRQCPGPERVDVATGAVFLAATAVSAGLTGGPRSPLAFLIMLSAIVGAARGSARAGAIVNGGCLALFVLVSIVSGPSLTGALATELLAFVLACVAATFVGGVLAQAEAEFRHASAVDTLTGLLTRESLEERFEELRAQARVHESPVALVLFDVDHFKTVNDRHGHASGDTVLRELAQRLRQVTRRFELLYRVGGEEFALLLGGVDTADAVKHAERLRAAINQAPLAGLPVTASFGVSAARGDAVDLTELHRSADAALYRAKARGRDRVEASADQELVERNDMCLIEGAASV